MKNFILALCVLTGLNVFAQKQVQKNIDYQGEAVKVEFPLASAIDVKTWNKSSIKVEASVKSEDPKDAEAFDLIVKKNGSSIEISSNTKKIFAVDGDDGLIVKKDHDFEFNYTIYVPKGVELELSSITGNLTSEYLEGDFLVELVTGNIDIKKFEGDLNLKTVTGKINLPAKNTSFKAETVMGDIYVDEEPNLVKKDRFVGQEMQLDLKNTKNRLSLNTVTGDIYLR